MIYCTCNPPCLVHGSAEYWSGREAALAAELVRLRTELERTRQAWVSEDDPMCEDVCMETCKGPCGVKEVQP